MHEIDFLPPEYHRGQRRRRQHAWSLVAAVLALAGIAATATVHYGEVCRLRGGLAELEPLLAEVLARSEALTRLRAEADRIEIEAKVIAYLEHPWPITQVLAALAEKMPEGVTLRQVDLQRVEAIDARRGPSGKPASSAGKEDAAAADLARLRRETDGRPLSIELTGLAADSETLHAYLASLGENGLFANLQLRSAEAAPDGPPTALRFRATLQLRPAYGQAGGPQPPRQG